MLTAVTKKCNVDIISYSKQPQCVSEKSRNKPFMIDKSFNKIEQNKLWSNDLSTLDKNILKCIHIPKHQIKHKSFYKIVIKTIL